MRTKRSDQLQSLRNVSLFQQCSDKELRQIAQLATELEVPAGKTLTREGEAAQEMFVIVAGKATVKKKSRKLAVVGPGDAVGELALLDHGKRTATVVADEPMTVLVLDPRGFSSLLGEHPSVAVKVARALAARLRALDEAVTN